MEPVFGSIIGVIFGVQGEIGVWTWAGAPILLAGLIMVIRGEAGVAAAEEEKKQAAGTVT